ncbi:MAG: hypothetical protein HYR88_15435, partial [Verrucomicrobia bacterium]|nr:hypothetical protein [Verrucomicrobiota bacterium]
SIGPSGELAHFHWLGLLAVAATLVSVWLASRVRVNESESPIRDSATSPERPNAICLKPRAS